MAHSCVSSLRFNSLIFSSSLSSPSSYSEPKSRSIHFPSEPLGSSESRKLSGDKKIARKSSHLESVYTGSDFYARDESLPSPRGIWSIRNDLRIPYSPFFPEYVQRGLEPPPAVQEGFQSVISQLFQHRIVRCGGEVNDEMANIVVAQLLHLDAVDPKQDIIMYINSPGGSVTAGLAMYDTMRHIRADVSTVCVGLAASMGAFLLSAGAKGKRYSMPNSRIMIHQPLGGAQGYQTSVNVQADEMAFIKANLSGHLALNTGQSLDKIYQDTDRDYFMSAKEAKEYGIVDAIIWNPLKALLPLPSLPATAAQE